MDSQHIDFVQLGVVRLTRGVKMDDEQIIEQVVRLQARVALLEKRFDIVDKMFDISVQQTRSTAELEQALRGLDAKLESVVMTNQELRALLEEQRTGKKEMGS